MAGMVSSEERPADEDDEEDKMMERDLSQVLSHLMVSVEKGIQRIDLGQVARDLWKWDGVSRRKGRHRATRDSWVQTSPPEETVESERNQSVPEGPQNPVPQKSQSLAPLASEEEFCSDTEMKLRTGQTTVDNPDVQISSESCEDVSQDNSVTQPNAISDVDDVVIDSQIALMPGSRDHCGRSVVFVYLEKLKQFPTITSVQLAQFLLYFQSIPKREVMRLGFLVIVDCRNASLQEYSFLEKSLSLVEVCAPGSLSLVLTWQKQNQKTAIFPLFRLHNNHVKFETIINVNQLLKYIKRNQLLHDFGGTYAYNHDEWKNFHKLLDPFTTGCHMTGRHLLTVMQELRSSRLPSSASLSNQMIEHQKRRIMEALEDEQLRQLEEEGDDFLKELEVYQKRSPHNQDYREAVEKCGLLYKHLKKILLRLTKLAEKRLGRLQECMMLKTFEEESSQVLSWLCRKGEETLKRHKTLGENVNAIREQENEFEKFYFLAMRQIERGNDLLEEIPKPKVVSSCGVDGMTSVLKNQLENFTERLEDARERLEDTSRCYNLLDKSYEWALETMRFVSHMKIDSATSSEALAKILQQLDEYINDHTPLSEELFDEMIVLAKKLKNDRLLDQCQVAKRKSRETVELVQTRHSTIKKAKEQMNEKIVPFYNDVASSIQTKPYVWRPVISSTPYRASSQTYLHSANTLYGSQNIIREPTGSYTSFPSSYYPTNGLRDNGFSDRFNPHSEIFLKGTIAENLNIQQSFTALPSKVDSFNLRSANRRSSSGSIKSSSKSSGSRETLNVLNDRISNLRGMSSPSDYHHYSVGKLSSKTQSWKMCEEALRKATEEVKAQNDKLQQQQLERTICADESSRMADCTDPDASPIVGNKPQRPAPVNMHLLRCASCSDFEELLSTKNAELEAEKKTKKMLKMVMREMIQTERDYVKSLEYIIENYIPLLQQSDITQALRGQRNVLFGNIEKIYEFHNCYFLQELEQCESSPYSVGQCFLKYEPQFYLYALYNKNKPKSDNLMAEYGSSFFKEKQNELGDKMDLASYLLKPVQRMGKYALLLKELLKECPERDNDYNDLKAAEEMVRFQLRHGNDLLAMDALRDCDVNVKEQGRLLKQDEFIVWQGKSRKALRHVFVFEDLILFSKARRDPECKGHDFYQYKHSIKTSDIGLTEQVGESPTKFEIWFRKRKAHDIYTLQAPSAEVKQAWVQDISKLLWKQAVRNRELRLAEMSSMGIGNKPCLDISPSQDQICDRSISLQQLNKAPRFRNSIAVSGCDNFNNINKRPHSIISVSSSSSGSSQSSTTFPVPSNHLESEEKESRRRSMAQQSQCSGESGFFTDVSMSGDSYTENDYQRLKTVERSDSILSQASFASTAAVSCPDTNDHIQSEQVSSSVCGKQA